MGVNSAGFKACNGQSRMLFQAQLLTHNMNLRDMRGF